MVPVIEQILHPYVLYIGNLPRDQKIPYTLYSFSIKYLEESILFSCSKLMSFAHSFVLDST